MTMETPAKPGEIVGAVGKRLMDCLNEAEKAPVATMGHELDDGTYEFLVGPVYLPHHTVTLTAPTETRQLVAHLRLESQQRPAPRRVLWLCKRGEGYAELDQPTGAVVIEDVVADPGADVVSIRYHLSR
jgi:hypothetical protein